MKQFMKVEEDSFQELKRELEEELGISSIPPPTKPMNPFMRFFLERSSQERSKGRKDWKDITKELTEEWKTLNAAKKEYYNKMYEIRLRERNDLFSEYQQLTNKSKPLAPYARFVQRKYPQYAKEYKNSNPKEINKLISEDWAKISIKDKTKLEDQYKKQLNDVNLDLDKSDRIDDYNAKVKRYHDQLFEDKEKVLKKYGLTKEHRARLKKIDRDIARRKRSSERMQERDLRRREAAQAKRKVKEANRIRQQQEREQLRKQREAQKLREKERAKQERQQKRVEQAQIRRKLKQQQKLKRSKSKKAVAAPAVKEENKESKKATPKASVKKPEVKKAEKTKKIKKPLLKPAKQAKSAAKQAPAKATPIKTKSKAKAKAKAKPAKKNKNKRVKK